MSDANGTNYHDDVAGELERMRTDAHTAIDLGDHHSAADVLLGGLARDRAASRRIEAARAKEARAAAEDRGLMIAALARIERTGLATHDLAVVALEVGQIALARVGAVKDYTDREFDVLAARRAAEQRRRETTSAEDLEAQAQLERRAAGVSIVFNAGERGSRPEIVDPIEAIKAKGDEARKTERTRTALKVVAYVVTAAIALAAARWTGMHEIERHHEPPGAAHEGNWK